jgi:hypothetical protein
VFHVCRRCDRGQSYCGAVCRAAAREASKRRARARHQASAEGRLDHRDAQTRYRERCQQRAGVTDQGGRELDKSGRLPARAEPAAAVAARSASRGESGSDGVVERAVGMLRCAFCGRASRWVRRGFVRRRWRESGVG